MKTTKLQNAGPGAFICEQVQQVQVRLVRNGKKGMKVIQPGGESHSPIVGIDAYVCGECDATHFVLSDYESEVAFNITLSVEDAEKLANALVNPVPRGR